MQQPKQQSFRVGYCLFVDKIRKKIPFKIKLVHNAREFMKTKILHFGYLVWLKKSASTVMG